MRVKQLIITQPNRIELQESEFDESLSSTQALVRTEYSVVSAGTEGSRYTGLDSKMPGGYGRRGYPQTTGYGNLGKVLAVGEEVSMCKPGDRVLSFSNHASVVKADAVRMALPVPKEVEGKHLVFSRMAGVSISSLRSSSVKPGDTVVVIGQGLVGNFAAQLFQTAGADVMAVDLSDERLEKSRACGIRRTLNSAKEDLNEAVFEWTEGKGAHIAIEAIGISEVISQAVSVTRRYGEVILLGTPRTPATFDATPMLLRIHMEAIRLIGSLEWRWPRHETDRVPDIVTNYRLITDWIANGTLVVDPLLTHLAAPSDCQRIYDGLTTRKEEFLSAVFDWSLA